MKKIIYSIINDDTFGIKVKDDIKLNILRILDMAKGKVVCDINEPMEVKGDKVEKFSLRFRCPECPTFVATYSLESNMKFLMVSLFPNAENPNLTEEYIIKEHSNGLIEYETRYLCKNEISNSNYEYYYKGEEISEKEAQKLFHPNTK